MTSSKLIRDFEFNDNTPQTLVEENFYSGWPVVYIINNDSEMYIGETYHSSERMKQHLKNNDRRRLKDLHIIGSSNFTKSATLDIESSLIELCKLENKRKLQNSNDGLVYHYYANKDYFRKDSNFFTSLWNELKKRGLVEGNIEVLLNSDLFKYSPYKSLNAEQSTVRDYVLEDILSALKSKENKSIFINGSAGTGKTILAIYLMKLLVTDGDYLVDHEEGDSDTLAFIDSLNEIRKAKPNLKVAYVVAMSSLRQTLKKVFSSIKGLKSSMVISPNEVAKNSYDVLIVDEAHRLMRRKNLAQYGDFDNCNRLLGLGKQGTQLDWILKNSKIQIMFYDYEQSIKPTDVEQDKFNELIAKSGKCVYNLSSQMRCLAGLDYIKYIKNVLNGKDCEPADFKDKYDFRLFEKIDDFCDSIYEHEKSEKLSRIVAGYGFEWVSKKNKNLNDIKIENREFVWNKKAQGWPLSIEDKQVIKEVGCIHTIQGYDLNYCGVIFGPEIIYRNGKIEIVKDKYFDANGKAGINDEELKDYIINIYSVLLTRGIKGTYVYVCDEQLREYLKKYISY